MISFVLKYKLIVIDAFFIVHYNIIWNLFSYNCDIPPDNQRNANESNRNLSESWKLITKFTTLIYNNSSYMYLYHLTHYNCPKYPQHTLNQWRILHYYELFCFLYALLSLDFTSKLQKVLIKVTTLIKDP